MRPLTILNRRIGKSALITLKNKKTTSVKWMPNLKNIKMMTIWKMFNLASLMNFLLQTSQLFSYKIQVRTVTLIKTISHYSFPSSCIVTKCIFLSKVVLQKFLNRFARAQCGKTKKKYSHLEIFRQINSIVLSLVKVLLS